MYILDAINTHTFFRVVVQLAKLTNPHLKVIASAGSSEKLEHLKSIGADVVINYKIDDMSAVLKEHGPIDM